ncbi:MAG: hypothetical protein K2N06_00525 [Oscillospiraceae bacterium]|nr:hypothetical protein [Oscillospiraceae bacterium]
MKKSKKFWLKNNRKLLTISMVIGFISVIVLAIVFAKKNGSWWFLAFLLTTAVEYWLCWQRI